MVQNKLSVVLGHPETDFVFPIFVLYYCCAFSDAFGGPNHFSWCEWCFDYENIGFTNFNPLGINWGDPGTMCDCCSVAPVESYDCTVDGCVDPGDGSGMYGSMADCEAMCSCDVYDSWPAFDADVNVAQQNSWCEWCLDYENKY